MSYSNQRKILLTFLTVVFAICCSFALRLFNANADGSSQSTTSLSGTLTADASYDDLAIGEDGVVFLGGYTFTVNNSLTVASGATLTIYAGSSEDNGYISISNGTLSGSFSISENDYDTVTVSGDSIEAECYADVYGNISVNEFILTSGEVYVNNAEDDLNDGYALTSAILNVKGGVAVMAGSSNADYDVYLSSSDSDGAFSYSGGSFYTPAGINVTPDGLINYSIGLKVYDGDTTNTQKVFKSVSKLYIDGYDYSVSISDTSKNSKNYLSVYLSGQNHSISVVDGDGEWATYKITYVKDQTKFTLSEEISSPSINLSEGNLYIYSQSYKQGTGEETLWGGQYNITVTGSTANRIIVNSDNDLTLNFTGGGAFTSGGAITLSSASSSYNPVFTIIFDGNTYTFSSDTAISITGGSVVVCESGSENNVTFGGIYAENSSVTLEGGAVSGDGYAIQAVSSDITVNGGSIVLS